MSTLSQIQEMFLMNISVNNGSNETGPNIEQQVYDQIQIYLSTNNLGNWQIVWGAGVYVKEAGTVPDNVIYLAYDPSTSRYFLSVAGTNVASKGVSIVDFMEDLDVATTWQWPWNNAGSDVLVANEGQMVLNILSALTANSYVNGVSSGSQVTLVQYRPGRRQGLRSVPSDSKIITSPGYPTATGSTTRSMWFPGPGMSQI
jgi:hypothetical protein